LLRKRQKNFRGLLFAAPCRQALIATADVGDRQTVHVDVGGQWCVGRAIKTDSCR